MGNYLAFTHGPSPRFEALEALPWNNRLFKDVFGVWFLSNLLGLVKKRSVFQGEVCKEATRGIQSSPGTTGQEMNNFKVKVFLSICSGYLKLYFSVCQIKMTTLAITLLQFHLNGGLCFLMNGGILPLCHQARRNADVFHPTPTVNQRWRQKKCK